MSITDSFEQLLNQLRQVHVFPSGLSCPGFETLGISHGFSPSFQTVPKMTIIPNQKHTNKVISLVDGHNQSQNLQMTNNDAADAIVANCEHVAEVEGCIEMKSHVYIGIRTADCLPILVRGPRSVAAIHAGWRGLCSGIITNALSMFEPGAFEQTTVAIGPAIGFANFEVGSDVLDGIQSKSLGLSSIQKSFVTMKGKNDRWHVDLRIAAVLNLLNIGLSPSRIHIMDVCTKADPTWHSYRRDGVGVESNYSYIAVESIKVE